MLFPIIVAVVAIFFIVYVATRKTNKNENTTTVDTFAPSIHEEIAKTVAETKTQKPIVDEVSESKRAPKTPKRPKDTVPAPTMKAKKQSPKKPKTVNA